jgi:hypothetical protein
MINACIDQPLSSIFANLCALRDLCGYYSMIALGVASAKNGLDPVFGDKYFPAPHLPGTCPYVRDRCLCLTSALNSPGRSTAAVPPKKNFSELDAFQSGPFSKFCPH